MSRTIKLLAVALLLLDGSFQPARLRSGDVTFQTPMTLGGGEVLLELDIGATGGVTKVTTLRSTPPFEELLRQAVPGWQFTPAREVREESEGPVEIDSKVLVAGKFRPPTLYDAPARGEVPQDVAQASAEVPFPTAMILPLYPPTTQWHIGQSVLVEVEVDENGKVVSSKIIRSAAGLDAAAIDAAKRWKFRAARREGIEVRSFAYIVFGFREPVVTTRDPGTTRP